MDLKGNQLEDGFGESDLGLYMWSLENVDWKFKYQGLSVMLLRDEEGAIIVDEYGKPCLVALIR